MCTFQNEKIMFSLYWSTEKNLCCDIKIGVCYKDRVKKQGVDNFDFDEDGLSFLINFSIY